MTGRATWRFAARAGVAIWQRHTGALFPRKPRFQFIRPRQQRQARSRRTVAMARKTVFLKRASGVNVLREECASISERVRENANVVVFLLVCCRRFFRLDVPSKGPRLNSFPRGRGGIGRRTSLRGWRQQWRGGSNPLDRTFSSSVVDRSAIDVVGATHVPTFHADAMPCRVFRAVLTTFIVRRANDDLPPIRLLRTVKRSVSIVTNRYQ